MESENTRTSGLDAGPISVLRGLGPNIAAHRRAAGLTQTDLAARIDRSVQWVSAVEQGRRHADRLTDLLRIAAVVGCRLEDLIGRPVDTLAPGVRPPRGEAVAAVRAVIMRAAVPAPSGAAPS
ncbi:MAG: helix-turn-helix domain-containing protein, partial [Micromonosporaceae bacterium]